MISIGVHPWADFRVTGNYTNIPEGDKYNLLRWGGGIPFLAYIWPRGNEPGEPRLGEVVPESWQWLADHGYRECVLRLFLDGTTSDNPIPPPDPGAIIEQLRDEIEEPIKRGIQIIGVQPDNEPDLERRGAISPADYAAWCLEFIRLWRARFPAYPLISPPLAQDSPDFAAWERSLLPVVAACDHLGVHYYWGRKPGDELPGAVYSPEWWDLTYDKPMIVTECGNANVQHDLAPVLRRWATYPWLRSYHVFVLSSPGFQQWNYTESTGNEINTLVREWRTLRRYPAETTLPPVPVNPPGGVDVAALTNVMHRMWRSREQVLAARDALTQVADEQLAQVVDYKQITGVM